MFLTKFFLKKLMIYYSMAKPFHHKKFFFDEISKIEILSKCLLCDATTKYITKVVQEGFKFHIGHFLNQPDIPKLIKKHIVVWWSFFKQKSGLIWNDLFTSIFSLCQKINGLYFNLINIIIENLHLHYTLNYKKLYYLDYMLI